MFNKNSVTKNEYRSTWEMAQKYTYNNVHNRLKIDSIIFELSIEKILNLIEKSNSNSFSQKDMGFQTKIFLVLYLFSSVIPSIKLCYYKSKGISKKKIKNRIVEKKKNNEAEFGYNLKFIISSPKNVETFLVNYLVEHNNTIKNKSVNLIFSSNFNTTKSIFLNKSIKTDFSLYGFPEFKYLSDILFPSINLKEICLTIYIVFRVPYSLRNYSKIFYNLPNFWTNLFLIK